MKVAVVIANHDRRELLRDCLRSLRDGGEGPLVVVVDNGSTDGSAAAAREVLAEPPARFPAAEVLELPHNTGFSHAYNVGILRALALGADGVLVLNNDTRVAPGALAALAAAAEHVAPPPATGDVAEESDDVAVAAPRIGMVAARVVLGAGGATLDGGILDGQLLDGQLLDGTGQRITLDGFGKLEDAGLSAAVAAAKPRETFCPYGAAAFYRRELLEDVAPDGEWFDEDFRLYCEELDLGWRARLRGWSCVQAPAAVVWHQRGATAGQYSELLGYYTSRNTLWNVVKNYPRWYAVRALILTLLRPLVLLVGLLAGRGPASKFGARISPSRLAAVMLRGWRDALRGLPLMWRKRRRIQSRRLVSPEEISRWFRELGEPFLGGLLR
jgi:GT2 family glycosyltransferase